MTSRQRLVPALLSAILLLPLIGGVAVSAALGWTPATTWSAQQGEATGAPLATPGGADLVEARRSAGEAAAQAQLLTSATGQLKDGTGRLADGGTKLADGTRAAADGSAQLADALVQLQAGTGQLGDGATEIANGVGMAVDQVVGINAVRGQLLTAIDGTLKDLEKDKSPEANDIRSQLGDLRNQVNNFSLDPAMVEDLKRLKDGSRELSNQLDVPGYAFHDGIYAATKGAKDLNAGMSELRAGVDEANKGIKDLDNGAAKVDSMAGVSKDKADGVRRALPAAPAAGQSGQSSSGATAQPTVEHSLSPIVAFLLAALSFLGAALLGLVRGLRGWRLAGLLAALACLPAVGVAVLATGPYPLGIGLAAVAGLLSALAGWGAARLLARAFGPAGEVLVVVGGIGQLALVGWLWKLAAAAQLGTAWNVVAHALPLYWSSAAVTVAGNAGSVPLFAGAAAVLAALATLGIAGNLWFARRNEQDTAVA